jgi:dolichol-phosphate mannosyltransferase
MATELSVIIPIFNEQENIAVLYNRLDSIVKSMEVNSREFIFVNDGSRDRSIEMIRALATADQSVKFIDFSRNFGHQIAVMAGLDHSRGQAVVIIDADLQDPPELIPELYAKMKSGNEVVYAKRRTRQGESYIRLLVTKLFYRLLAKMTSIDIPVDTGDFRIIDRKVVDILKQMPEQQKYLRGQISWIGFKQTFLEYDRDERFAGKSGYTFRKLFRLALDGITSFSNFPLKFATMAGFIVSGISFLIMLYAIYSRFSPEQYVPGWASLMLAVLFIGGIQLIGIGIIGEYISRISDNVRNRPLYIIRDSNIS